MNCPVCDGTTRLKSFTDDFDGLILKSHGRQCRDPDCAFTWLPVEEEKRLDDILLNSRPDILCKLQARDIDDLRNKLTIVYKNTRILENNNNEWKKGYKHLKQVFDINTKHATQVVSRLDDDLKKAKELIAEILQDPRAETAPWFSRAKRIVKVKSEKQKTK